MVERPVVNASPLILLGRAGQLDLLQLAGSPVVVPHLVAEEIASRGQADAAARALAATNWLQVEDAGPISAVIANWDLGAGESSVLTWALSHPGSEAIIDDLMGRRCARTLGIPVRGTLGLVLVAKQRCLIPAARPVAEHLRRCGMYLSNHVLNAALAKVGE